jgi:hypothetical protein
LSTHQDIVFKVSKEPSILSLLERECKSFHALSRAQYDVYSVNKSVSPAFAQRSGNPESRAGAHVIPTPPKQCEIDVDRVNERLIRGNLTDESSDIEIDADGRQANAPQEFRE